MSVSVVLDVGLGLMLLYYVLGLVVSGVTGLVARWTEMRAQDLTTGLQGLLSDGYETFIEHPCIHNLQEKRWIPWKGFVACQVDRIPAPTFARTLFDILAPGVEEKGTVEDIRKGIKALPDGDLKHALMIAIHGGIKELQEAQARIEGWYNDAMKGVTALYRHHTRRFVLWLTLALTVLIGADSIDIATSLWQEPTVRAAVVAKVDRVVQEQPEGDVAAVLSELGKTRIPLTWSRDRLPDDLWGWVLKVIGLVITWLAASQGSSFWYDLLRQVRSGPAPSTGSAQS